MPKKDRTQEPRDPASDTAPASMPHEADGAPVETPVSAGGTAEPNAASVGEDGETSRPAQTDAEAKDVASGAPAEGDAEGGSDDPGSGDDGGQEEEEDERLTKMREVVQVETEEVGPLRLKLRVTVPRAYLDERLSEELEEMRQDALVPGFRRGRAPMVLVEKRYAPEISDQMLAQVVGLSLVASIKEKELETLGEADFWVSTEQETVDDQGVAHRGPVDKLVSMEEALEILKLPKEGDLSYSAEVELRPEFELPETEHVPVRVPRLDVTDEDVDKGLQRMMMHRARFEPVEKGGVEKGDLLYADLKISVDDSVIESRESFDVPARATVVRGIPLPDFGDQAAGRSTGETVVVEAPVPEDFDVGDLRGKTAKLEFVIREIKRLHIPTPDLETLKTWGFESEDDLRTALRERLESQLQGAREEAIRNQIEEYLVEHTDMELPVDVSRRQSERMASRKMVELLRKGVPEVEIKAHVDEIRTQAQATATRDLKTTFIMDKLAESLDVEVREEEINSAIASIAAEQNRRFDRVRDDLSKNDGLSLLYIEFRNREILNKLAETAKVEEVEEVEEET